MPYMVQTLEMLQKASPLYEEIFQFLLKTADHGVNEHFHWARFEWMMHHELLNREYLDRSALFRDGKGHIAGMCAFDTVQGKGAYIVHGTDDGMLLGDMVDYSAQHYPEICLNMTDGALKRVLEERNWHKGWGGGSMMAVELDRIAPPAVPDGYVMTPPDFDMDMLGYQRLLHEGYEDWGPFKPWPEDVMSPLPPHWNRALKVFAIRDSAYCAHAGVWYCGGDTAYVEPVVTLPQHRRKGLAGACLRTALLRAKALGAKRAVVMAEDAFYSSLGFENSTLCLCWEPNEDD